VKLIKKRNFITSVLLLSVFVFLASTAFVFGAAWDADPGDLPDTTIKEVVINGINWLVGIVATVSVIIVLVGGVLWVTAGGDEERAKTARRYLVAGLAGLAVALGAWAIVRVITQTLFP